MSQSSEASKRLSDVNDNPTLDMKPSSRSKLTALIKSLCCREKSTMIEKKRQASEIKNMKKEIAQEKAKYKKSMERKALGRKKQVFEYWERMMKRALESDGLNVEETYYHSVETMWLEWRYEDDEAKLEFNKRLRRLRKKLQKSKSAAAEKSG